MKEDNRRLDDEVFTQRATWENIIFEAEMTYQRLIKDHEQLKGELEALQAKTQGTRGSEDKINVGQ